ncbi:hypothetical protein [Aquimarina macrocephali]|uniref:hypothetical protein n=1 Tax=Aquimarina macrocephali TaxID=666563 RepID=UPI003F6713F4
MQGTFEMKYQYGEVMIERFGNWQLEKIEEYGVISLNKIEKINDCKYLLSFYKSLKREKLPEPDKKTKSLTQITYIEGNKYYYESSMVGTDMILKGVFIKKSNEISDEFKKLIAEEEKSLD